MKHNNIKLSICICTVFQRKELFAKLYDYITHQIKQHFLEEMVELNYILDNKEMSVGAKRQLLLEQSNGEYIVFVDDDDWVDDNYVPEIIQALKDNPDCVGFLIHVDNNGVQGMARASMNYEEWGSKQDGYDYVRSIYHKTPVKKELALKAGFPDMRFGEDYEYSMRLKKYLSTETFINKVLYYYRYKPEPNKYGQ